MARARRSRTLKWNGLRRGPPSTAAWPRRQGPAGAENRATTEHAATTERTETLSRLAGAMGHEIAHVTRRHAARQTEGMQQANVAVTLACVPWTRVRSRGSPSIHPGSSASAPDFLAWRPPRAQLEGTGTKGLLCHPQGKHESLAERRPPVGFGGGAEMCDS